MKYVDLSMGVKPHLLIKRVNNLGSETRIHYTPSTKFYVQDKLAGKPWITRLAFPVQCVEKVEVIEHITQSKFVSRYAYHHGYFDGTEREFRGFAMVEKWDTEDYDTMNSSSPFASIKNLDPSMHSTPVYTKTWYHTGLFLDQSKISQFLAHDYFGANTSKPYLGALLSDSIIPSALRPAADACRALNSAIIRQELYGLDGSPLATTPFSVTENNYTVIALQPLADNHGHSVFRVDPRESMICHFERNLDDPRVQHSMTIEFDSYGNVLKSLNIAYARQPGQSTLDPSPRAAQETSLVAYTENEFTNAINMADDYFLPAPAASRQSQIYGFGQSVRLQFEQFSPQYLDSLTSLPFEAGNVNTNVKRLVQQSCTKYRSNDLTQLLDVGALQSMGLPGQSYQLAFTPGLFKSVVGRGTGTMADLIPNSSTTIGTNL
jgi:hypothetical protein